jgi:ATP-dependent Lon protease
MTGEVTLTGRVLPVGGIREKVLAARRAGIQHILMPVHNKKDLVDLPVEVKADMTFEFVETIDDVIKNLFPVEPVKPLPPKPAPKAAKARSSKPVARDRGSSSLPR